MKLLFKKIFISAVYAAVTAAAINALLFFIFRAAGIITDDIVVTSQGDPMTIGPILISSFLPALLSSLVFYLFHAYTKNGFKNFTILSLVLLLFSFSNPFLGIPDVTLGYALALNLMHVVVAGSVIFFYYRLTNSESND